MARSDADTDKSPKSPAQGFSPADLLEMGRKQAALMAQAQSELLGGIQESTREWFASVQEEAVLASELVNTLMVARSIPDVSNAYQEWGSLQMDIWTKIGRRLAAGSQNAIESGSRIFSNGWSAPST